MSLTTLEFKASGGDVGAQRALAAELDAQGRHEDAINWLARAAQTGDAAALTELGLRLVTGRNAPLLPKDGVRLLSDAMAAGGAEAAGHLAVLVGGGFYLRQDWSAALGLLRQSAGLGSEAARAQLSILAPDGGEVDLAAWLKPPEGVTLNAAPLVRSFKSLVPPEACAWVIQQSKGRLMGAELYDPETGAHEPGVETRFNTIANFGLQDTNLLNLLIQARASAAAGVPFSMSEAFAVLHYDVGEEYGEHHDYLDPAIPAYAAEISRMGQRVATCLVYLNDGYEGGATEFPGFDVSFKGGLGDALVFQSAFPDGRPDPRSVHAGRPPTSGEKWILSQFFRNRPVTPGAPRF